MGIEGYFFNLIKGVYGKFIVKIKDLGIRIFIIDIFVYYYNEGFSECFR